MEEARNECDHEEYGETEEENRPQDGYRRFRSPAKPQGIKVRGLELAQIRQRHGGY